MVRRLDAAAVEVDLVRVERPGPRPRQVEVVGGVDAGGLGLGVDALEAEDIAPMKTSYRYSNGRMIAGPPGEGGLLG